MKLGIRNFLVVACILFKANVQAQTIDTVKRNSVNDLIELENSKNLIPTTKNNPPAYIQNNSEPKASSKPKKALLKVRRKRNHKLF